MKFNIIPLVNLSQTLQSKWDIFILIVKFLMLYILNICLDAAKRHINGNHQYFDRNRSGPGEVRYSRWHY